MKKIIVVGGGAAGMMAAYAASKTGACVCLLERNEKLGKKIFITGKGRCNVTNHKDTFEFFDSVISNPKFLYSSIYSFDASAVMEFFENNGCPLKVERGERVFPVSDHSSDVIRTLEQVLLKQNVEIRKNSFVKDLMIEDNCVQGVVLNNKEQIPADAVIVATGGSSYESTGSDGNFHKILESINHPMVEMRPGLVPMVIREKECAMMQGLSLKNVTLTLLHENKVIYEDFGEMLFTHFGISGPLALSASSYMNKKYYGKECVVRLDLKPALTYEKLDKRILRDFDNAKNKQFKNAITDLLPSKMLSVIPDLCKIPEDKPVNEITKEERKRLVDVLKGMEFHVTGTRDMKEAIVTIGGVDTKRINPSTLESKIYKGLYFAGELMDVDALTGGFNLQIAWSTGHLAGESAATESRDS